jgi:hypothetical protein
MPKFTIEHKTSHAAQETYEKLKNFLSKSGEIQKFDSKVSCDFNDSQKSCNLSGSQFKAKAEVTDLEKGARISIHVDLPLLLTPIKGKVSEVLTKMLKKHLS